MLERQAEQLKEAGLEALNVSLDAIDEDIFFRISRRHSATRIIRGIDAALHAGLDVKLNAVIMKGINDSEILPLLEFALTELWRRREDGRLTHYAYEQIGGVVGGLARGCDQAYQALPAAQRL